MEIHIVNSDRDGVTQSLQRKVLSALPIHRSADVAKTKENQCTDVEHSRAVMRAKSPIEATSRAFIILIK